MLLETLSPWGSLSYHKYFLHPTSGTLSPKQIIYSYKDIFLHLCVIAFLKPHLKVTGNVHPNKTQHAKSYFLTHSWDGFAGMWQKNPRESTNFQVYKKVQSVKCQQNIILKSPWRQIKYAMVSHNWQTDDCPWNPF